MNDNDKAEIEAAVHRVLDGVLGRKSMTFSEFRFGMLSECEVILTDQEIHAIFQACMEEPLEWDAHKDEVVGILPPDPIRDLRTEDVEAALRLVDQAVTWINRPEAKQERVERARKLLAAQPNKDWKDLTLGEVADRAVNKVRAVGKMLRATRHP